MKFFIKTMKKWVLRLLFLTFALVVTFFVVIWVHSPGREPSFETENTSRSVTEIQHLKINGVKQRLVIRSRDTINPVLLIVHGGPGGYQVPFLYESLGVSVEDLFTVCYWDQRGSGPSYDPSLSDSTISLSQIVADGIKVSEYLKARFNHDKIFIEGQSWGTAVASFMVNRSPELYHAYIGIGQVTNTLESEKLTFDFVKNEALKRQDTAAISTLNDLGPPPYQRNEQMIEAVDLTRYFMHKYEQTQLSITQSKFMKLLLFYKGFTLKEKLKILFGDAGHSFVILWPQAMQVNLFEDIPKWSVPAYFIQGDNDHQTETSLVKAYFDSISAPVKKYFAFEDSGHVAHWQKPLKYLSIIRTLRRGHFDSKD